MIAPRGLHRAAGAILAVFVTVHIANHVAGAGIVVASLIVAALMV
jgi:succinate dehydrogenase/fumarate reductase cytochrome b subunit